VNGFYHNCLSVDGWMPLLPDGTPAIQYVWDHRFAPEALLLAGGAGVGRLGARG
jgi:hypothetical protein